MTRTVDSAVFAALQGRSLVARDFLWVIARDRTTGDPVPDGMWSDDYNTTASIIDPDSGSTVSRTWTGVGTLIQMDDIPLVSDLTVQSINVTLSQVSDHVATLVRTYDCKQARVEIYRGLYDPATNTMVAAAEPRFVGFVDEIEIKTPTENSPGAVILTCVSNTQEMTRSNSDTRSNASQFLRNATDNFFNDVAVVGTWQIFWGRNGGTLTPSAASIPTAIGAAIR